MWLIHQFRPLIHLGICKEYPIMAKAKTARSGNGRTQQTLEGKTSLIPINLEDEIRRRAYELYEQRGYLPGNEQDDWFAAEREILSRYTQRSA
jgi:Protein of unknown function (DUF2934)